ncbi:hypothetical protein V5799_007041 [Amblyomma americanum]|uniref:RING-type domain-containing protein n=1 Tax=Amblyomma americanum TaxID=6943 RepID=A0AAQ4DUN1_AMBAM
MGSFLSLPVFHDCRLSSTYAPQANVDQETESSEDDSDFSDYHQESDALSTHSSVTSLTSSESFELASQAASSSTISMSSSFSTSSGSDSDSSDSIPGPSCSFWEPAAYMGSSLREPLLRTRGIVRPHSDPELNSAEQVGEASTSAPSGEAAPEDQPCCSRHEELRARIAEMERVLNCPICRIQRREVVFTCGHAFCWNCSILVRWCALCRQPIRKRIRLY